MIFLPDETPLAIDYVVRDDTNQNISWPSEIPDPEGVKGF
jgi:hypothetical protein